MNALLSIGSNLFYGYISAKVLDFILDDIGDRMTSFMGHLYVISKDAHQQIYELDLEHRIKIIRGIINAIEDKEKYNSDNLIFTQLEYIMDTIKTIQILIQSINDKTKGHKNKYLWRWRSIGIDREIDELKTNSRILQQRYDIFINTINIKDAITI
jgi:hypothetical protein